MSFFRKKKTESEQPPPSESIYDLARTLGDRFAEVAHARELLDEATFKNAVRTLTLSKYSLDELLSYAQGENAIVASLALCTIGSRREESAVSHILVSINDYSGRWTKFFALQTIDDLVPAPQPLLGRVLLALNDDWYDGYDKFLQQFIREFARKRVAAGEPASFGEALEKAHASRFDDTAQVIEKLDRDIAAPLREELKVVRDRKTNVDYLATVGKVWGDEVRPPFIEHEKLLAAAEMIEQTIAGERRRSVLVVGEEGVGKTTIIHAAAERLRAAGWIVFDAGATELAADQMYIGQLEGRIQQLVQNMRGARRVVWIIPNFHELQYAGAHRYSPGGAMDMLLSEIESGAIAVIGEITASAYHQLAERKLRVRTSFVTLRVDAMRDAETLDLARKWAGGLLAAQNELLAEAWQLTTQYLGMRAAPGNLLGLLGLTRSRLQTISGDANVAITLDDILATLSQLTGLPRSILDDRESLDLADLRAHFASRVLGQPEAIDVLVERVAMIKAAVTDPTRPSGVFLFAGPTGTGKTEIAKSLAKFLFGSADRMIRIDMSELKTADSVSRLVGGEDDTSSLVLEIRKQPFSVVLLDEFEKAHPHVWDLFLQVFDDGRLSDRRGATADLRHAIIIMTSNIGSAIRTFGRAGFSEAAGAAFQTSAVMKALEHEFRKEFLNRIDRVVVFQPLSRETMRGILRKELAQAFQRRGLRNRDWAVEWDESALDFLLAAGFTEDLGARPLKRAVERYLLTPLAEMIVTRRAPTGDQFLFIRADGEKLVIDFVDPNAAPPAEVIPEAPTTLGVEALILGARGTAEERDRLVREYNTLRAVIRGDEWRERKSIALSMTSLPEFWSSPERFEILGDAELRDRVETAIGGIASLLERLRRAPASELVRRVAQQLWLIGIAIGDLQQRRPHEAMLAIEGSNQWAKRVAAMYRAWGRRRGMRIETVEENAARVVLSVSGFGAHTLLAPESGLHVLEIPVNGRFDRLNARVRVAPVPPGEFREEPENVVVRRYREEPSSLVRDSVRNWRTGRMDLVMEGNFDVLSS